MELQEINWKEHEYTTYPRRFVAWRWYKPLLVGLLFAVFYLLLTVPVTVAAMLLSGDIYGFIAAVTGGYDTMDVYTAAGTLVSLGSVAVMLGALALAALIVRDRPWSSYSSARGGWDWGVFGRCLAVALAVVGLPNVIPTLIDGATGSVRFTVAGLVLATVLGPLQCVAEEYVFRGLLMQTFGSWTRLPLLAVALQAAVFALMHPYNTWGVITIAVMGLILGASAWFSRGLEASSALHIVNNMSAFYLTGFGYGNISATVTAADFLFSTAFCVIYLAAIVLLGRKFHWFERIRRDDVALQAQRLAAKAAPQAPLPAQESDTTADNAPESKEQP